MTDATQLPLLRLEVGRFRIAERRRSRFEVTLHVGTLAGERQSVTIPRRAALDHQVRAELVSALLETADAPTCAWTTRPGPTELMDQDTRWLVAAATAFGQASLELRGFYVVTRAGWLDVLSGERRVWKRLRLDRAD